jgi:hypothetical protein
VRQIEEVATQFKEAALKLGLVINEKKKIHEHQ